MRKLILSKIFIISIIIDLLSLLISIYFYINYLSMFSFLIMMVNLSLNYKLINYWDSCINREI